MDGSKMDAAAMAPVTEEVRDAWRATMMTEVEKLVAVWAAIDAWEDKAAQATTETREKCRAAWEEVFAAWEGAGRDKAIAAAQLTTRGAWELWSTETTEAAAEMAQLVRSRIAAVREATEDNK
jgi:hypothetical protein